MMSRFAFIALVCLIASYQLADAKMYKWTDAEGQIHYTDDLQQVPAEIQDKEVQKEERERKTVEERVRKAKERMAAEETARKEKERMATDEKPLKTEPLRIVPPVTKGTIAELWSGFREDETLYIPVFPKTTSTPDNPNQDWREGYLVIPQVMQGKSLKFIAVYTDTRLFNKTVIFRTAKATSVLKWAMDFPDIDGIYFNPASRVYSETKYSYGINQYGLAEIVGYIESTPDTTNRPWHMLALEAEANQKWYQVLYYWGMSYRESRPGDDWKKAEFAKVGAYNKIGYRWAKERAIFELDWYTDKYGKSPEATALRKTLVR